MIGLYYYGEVTMKQIGAEIGVNESRVSQLHARAIRRLRQALGEMKPEHVAEMRQALVEFASSRPAMAKAALPQEREGRASQQAVVIPYKRTPAAKPAPARAAIKPARRPAVAAAR